MYDREVRSGNSRRKVRNKGRTTTRPVPRLFFFPTTVPLFLHLAPAGLAVLAVFCFLPFRHCCLFGLCLLGIVAFSGSLLLPLPAPLGLPALL